MGNDDTIVQVSIPTCFLPLVKCCWCSELLTILYMVRLPEEQLITRLYTCCGWSCAAGDLEEVGQDQLPTEGLR